MKRLPARFRIIDEPFGEAIACRLLDTATRNSAVIFPFLGGTVNSFIIRKNGSPVEMMDGYTSYQETTGINSSFKGSNLFPFPNRVEEGSYRYGKEKHQLSINFPDEGNAIHGLVYDKKFAIKRRTESHLECILEIEYSSIGRDEGYPYSYRLNHKYCLSKDKGFTCSTRITNDSDMTIPVAHGFHPYFSAGADSIDDLILQFSAEHMLKVNSRNIPTGARSAYYSFSSPKKIKETALDNCFCLNDRSGRSTVTITNPRLDIRLTIWQETGPGKYNYLQLYTPPDRQSIAVEPMTCIPNSLNNGEGLIHLFPDKTTSLSWGIHASG